MSDITFSEIPANTWEKDFPAPVKVEKQDPYAGLIAALQQGKIVAVDYTDETSLKGIRITIGRKARAAGFVPEFRVSDHKLAVRKTDAPLPSPKERKPRTKKES